MATNTEARGSDTYVVDNTPPIASSETEQESFDRKWEKLNQAHDAVCKGVETLNMAPTAMTGEDHGERIVLRPNIGHFSHSVITFEPTKVSIAWTDKEVDEETGFPSPAAGATQTIPLTDVSEFIQGFEGGGLLDSYGQPLNCYAERSIDEGIARQTLECSDSLAQKTKIDITAVMVSLTYSFQLALSPLDNMPINCNWGIMRRPIVSIP